jgi:hypothetical protein
VLLVKAKEETEVFANFIFYKLIAQSVAIIK